MKKTILTIATISTLFIAACGGGQTAADTDTTSSANKNAVAASSNAAQDTAASKTGAEPSGGSASSPAVALMGKSDCSTCHKEEVKVVGPAFVDVAKKYDNSDATIAKLADKIIKGGSGVWGDVAMPPHPLVSVDDAKTMVKYILSLKK